MKVKTDSLQGSSVGESSYW